MKFSLKRKAFLVVLLIAAMLTAATLLVSYRLYADTMDRHYEQLTMNLAKTAAQMVDKQAVRGLTQEVMSVYRAQCEEGAPDFDAFTEADWAAYEDAFAPVRDSETFAQVFDTLYTLKEENDVLWMYICYMDAQTGKAVYIVDADVPGEANLPGACDPIEENNRLLMAQGIYDFPAYITNYVEYGWLCSASAAITDEDGQVIANAYVDISMNDVMADRHAFLIRLSLIVLATAAVLVALLGYAVNRAVVRPINRLADAAGQFVSDKEANPARSALSQLSIRTGDEIEHLTHSMQRMEQEINAYIANLTAVTAERERIGAELDVARSIQSSMLPCIFPPFPQRQEFDIFASMNPAKEVGGDFYDFFLVDEDHLALVIADVSGKGVPAAMFMVIAKTLIKNAAQTGLSPKDILETVNNQLCENNDAEMFVTVWLGILQISTGRMTCANAGHEFPALLRAGGRFELYRDRHGFVLAGMENSRYREYELQLGWGDKLLVYTDGVTEATNGQNQLYGAARMLSALNRHTQSDCRHLLHDLQTDIDAFVGEAPQFDDITMLCLAINPPAPHTMAIEPDIAHLPDATAFFEDLLSAQDAPVKVIAQVNIAVDEILSNIVHYSGATRITLSCRVRDGQVQMTFGDDGKPYDPTQRPDPDITLAPEARDIGGMGIFMVKKLMDAVAYERRDGMNLFTVEKRW